MRSSRSLRAEQSPCRALAHVAYDLRVAPAMRRVRRLLPALLTAVVLPGCAVVAVADAAVTVAATAVKITAKTVGAVADVIIPDAAPAPVPPAATGSK